MKIISKKKKKRLNSQCREIIHVKSSLHVSPYVEITTKSYESEYQHPYIIGNDRDAAIKQKCLIYIVVSRV